MKRHVGVDLVKSSLQERRIDGDKRFLTCHCHPGGQGHCVLLGDSGVEDAVREALRHVLETGG